MTILGISTNRLWIRHCEAGGAGNKSDSKRKGFIRDVRKEVDVAYERKRPGWRISMAA